MTTIYEELKRTIDQKAERFIRELTAIVNAAGEGMRLKPFTDDVPKALIQVGKVRKPIIYWAILPLLLGGISKFTFGIRYRGELIKEEFGSGEDLSEQFGREIKVDYIEEPEPLGRAGCIKYGLELGIVDPRKPALILNASDILRLDLGRLSQHYLWQRANYGFEILQVYVSGYQVQFGLGKLHPTTGQVVSFVEKPFKDEPTNIACYCIHERLEDFTRISKIPTNPEDELVYRWLEAGVLGSYVLPREDVISIKFAKDVQRTNEMDIEKFLTG